MQRRNFIKLAGVSVMGLPSALRANALSAVASDDGKRLYVDPGRGNDRDKGGQESPLRSLSEAISRMNRSRGHKAFTIILTEGIHVIDRTLEIAPRAGRFTSDARLTIRAAVSPGESGWHVGRMPTLIHTMPLSATWNGRADPLGGAADGMLIGTSHVSIRGLRILGRPAIETPQPGQILRLYSISRLDRSLEDLEISQCLFVGDDFVAPSHVAIIALGNGLRVHHCVFRNLKIAAVFWQGGSTGHAMHHCVCDGLYGSAVWTSGIAEDFLYTNNLVTGGNYVWTNQSAASAAADEGARAGKAVVKPSASLNYQVRDCHFAGNRRLAGSGTGARLEYQDIDPGFMKLERTIIEDAPVRLSTDATRFDYLHAPADSVAAKLGAGLFLESNGGSAR
jgi:hypothetical protein